MSKTYFLPVEPRNNQCFKFRFQIQISLSSPDNIYLFIHPYAVQSAVHIKSFMLAYNLKEVNLLDLTIYWIWSHSITLHVNKNTLDPPCRWLIKEFPVEDTAKMACIFWRGDVFSNRLCATSSSNMKFFHNVLIYGIIWCILWIVLYCLMLMQHAQMWFWGQQF